MAYLEEFSQSITSRNYTKLMELWQEYCESDEIDPDEMHGILTLLKQPDLQPQFGTVVEEILPLVMSIQDNQQRLSCLAILFDIQTTHSQILWDLAHETINTYFGQDSRLQDKLRLVGLRTKEKFQGAISNFVLLNHLQKGNFVYHNAGWGVGEVIECSFLREQIIVEFENLGGSRRDISFKNAYRSLQPLPSEHLLSLRFANPELLGEMALKDPVGLIIKILTDIGPKNAREIKDLLCGTIIDESSYAKWWQNTRTKLKKDARIDTPEEAKGPYRARRGMITIEERVEKALSKKRPFQDTVSIIYGLVRDFPQLLKDEKARSTLFEKTAHLLENMPRSDIQKLVIHLLLRDIDEKAAERYGDTITSILFGIEEYAKTIGLIDIIPFRKKVVMAIRSSHPDWELIFGTLLLDVEPASVKEYIMKELLFSESGQNLLKSKLEYLMHHPARHPGGFVWYFQKISGSIGAHQSSSTLFFSDQRSLERFFEGFLLLYSTIEFRPEMKDLLKKMYVLITENRFKLVRDILKESDLAHAREFLLLASKCGTLTEHDKKILRSLVAVVHTSLEDTSAKEDVGQHVLWTTAEKHEQMKSKIHHISTVEMVDNAREIEEARKHGDLKENSEYKFAVERRSRLQRQLKGLSDEFQRARIITPDDISRQVVGVGSKVSLQTDSETPTYTILGPWDADSEANILSIDSKVAQALVGKKIDDVVDLKGQKAKIVRLFTIFDA